VYLTYRADFCLHHSLLIYSPDGSKEAVAQAVGRRPTTKARVRSYTGSCSICGGEIDIVKGNLEIRRVFPVITLPLLCTGDSQTFLVMEHFLT